ncbi:NAD-dependent epimerase/dehydratase family protein [Streptomyces scabiei]|uniref:NAD-dependent epimerase/dehydratase family protein n=1 Tax=Streptomyces scabiei TaxID=1930 RepID=UPI001B30DC23|nr:MULTISPECIES: NAD-dependent epimerase/dehydratase family protein [Streptomyces]MBP5870861.1 NAD-dependent epimerase/dehydratase family protein [Streptomyces sp. LBUM 1485]MBP5913235.1 NAD-dependent epimerase/dehydratase family protein [Streptomyces sp. LBUM 1486]MDX2532294.1 NAD-dependent epimerase/dehydratase family protein [Streptomyces scabiei]MDX2794600.1 NAD-dependent epimerase/dehydratase family protein [Streptomyces scabiei]MDX3822398.1 NAD-dependent epimerase/dehydratase family prot
MKILLTGAAGFVGSHVLAHLLANTDADIVCPWTLRHHGNSQRVATALDNAMQAAPDRRAWGERVTTVMHDLATPMPRTMVDEIGPVDYVLNIASESHVDRSISEPASFIRNNVELALNVLDYARQVRPKMVLHMGTDEEYGPAYGDYKHREWDTVLPSNPYSASKAAQSAIATSYWRTYGVPVVLTRTMNLIAPGQDAEKFVPTVIRKILAGETVQIHASPEGIPGSRHWIDAREFGAAWLHLLRTVEPEMYPDHDRPSMFHVVGEERSNLAIAQTIADILGKPLHYELVSFHSSRPGHDLRYALDGSKLAEAGWTPGRPLEETLTDIVKWYTDRPAWLAA